jgi:putative tryptophan/tyrosine transport system substrate-binding protein
MLRSIPLLALLLLLGVVLALDRSSAAGGIAVLMSSREAEYKEALRGFKESARQPVVAEYDMEDDVDRGRKQLAQIEAKIKPELILAVGFSALQAVANQTDIPIVYCMVLNPPSLLGDNAKKVTGASMNIPVEQPLRLLKQLGPNIKRIGVVYNPARTGYLVRRAVSVARQEGLQLVTREVNSARDAIAAVGPLLDEVDALWLIPDETLLQRAVVQQMLLLAYRKRVPLLGLAESHAKMGALLALSFASPQDIGRQAGELANEVLSGKSTADLPYTTARQTNLIVNLKAAQKLGVDVPKAVVDRASTVLQ